jgi:SAM-dependent methyltransferase
MHPTAIINADYFFRTYLKPEHSGYFVIEIGSQIVGETSGSLRDFCPKNAEYIGVDFVSGNGVDVVLTDPYTLPFEDNSVDVCLSTSVFEHSEMFWVLFLEILRILKPDGIFYLNVPSNGYFHRYPVDCWRFYPDSGRALVNWAKRNKFNPALLESYISFQKDDVWNDFVAVFIKDEVYAPAHTSRITDTHTEFFNGYVYGSTEFINLKDATEDMLKIRAVGQIASGKMAVR